MRRHDLDLVSLIAGLLAVGVGTAAVLDAANLAANRWVGAVVLLLIGGVGLAAGWPRPGSAAGETGENGLPHRR